MTDLLLQPAADSEGQLSEFDFDVIADGESVGRITLDTSGLVWFWIMDASLRLDRDPTEGHEPTREAAMQAFVKPDDYALTTAASGRRGWKVAAMTDKKTTFSLSVPLLVSVRARESFGSRKSKSID